MAEQKCCSCSNYECSWRVRFEPVEGWKAKPTKLSIGHGQFIDSYAIKDCPEFIQNQLNHANRAERTAPCCEACNSISKKLCMAKNGTCRTFQKWEESGRKPRVTIKDSDVERLFYAGGTIDSMARELNCDASTIQDAKRRLGLKGNMKKRPEYRIIGSDGKELARGTAKHCYGIAGISEPTFRRLLRGQSNKNGLRAEAL